MMTYANSSKSKIWALTLFCLLSVSTLFSQNSELGLALGGASYTGDIEINPNALFAQMRPMAGVFYRYHFSNAWAIRGQFTFCQLYANEKRFPVPSFDNYREKRGVSFTTSLAELSVLPELRLFNIGNINFYAFTGIAGFYFSPTVDYNEPNPIIGDKNPDKNADFSQVSWAIPVGGGMQWPINEQTALGFEISGRKTGTDALDRLGFVANKTAKDYYFFMNFTFSTFIGDIGAGRSRKNIGCPTF
jgi:hypothetical protein